MEWRNKLTREEYRATKTYHSGLHSPNGRMYVTRPAPASVFDLPTVSRFLSTKRPAATGVGANPCRAICNSGPGTRVGLLVLARQLRCSASMPAFSSERRRVWGWLARGSSALVAAQSRANRSTLLAHAAEQQPHVIVDGLPPGLLRHVTAMIRE